ncbi:hypothetical protein [Streptomyces enissocaesilis]|uniref:Uncharacterized protein n=1 Tax=Streptomyces enissocaesilis TaxID=332589 RepID=A0ABN3X6C1_9ACTN
MPRISIVTTTIRPSDAIGDYARELDRSGLPGEVIVVGDRRGDAEVAALCGRLSAGGLAVRHVGVADQRDLLRRAGRLRPFLRWNSIQRRNLGYLLAAESSTDIMVSVDDDNLPEVGDYLRHHLVVGSTGRFPAVRSGGGWFNVGEALRCEPPVPLRHRGYPLGRITPPGSHETTHVEGRVVVNAGLWTDDPDIDATTRIALHPEVTAIDAPWNKEAVALAPSTWCPFNSQNTAFHRDVLPATFLWNMREPVGHDVIDRYDDIFMSYFARRLIDHFGDLVCYGPPVVEQRRNDHDLLADLTGEIPGMRLTDGFVDLLRSITLTATTYFDAARELTELLQEAVVELGDDRAPEQAFWLRSLAAVDGWLDAYTALTRDSAPVPAAR